MVRRPPQKHTLGTQAVVLGHNPPASTPTRPHLLRRRRLDASSFLDKQCGAIEIVAPAGFGKTTMVRSWLDEISNRGMRGILVSIDDAAREPITLIRLILAALRGLPADKVVVESEVGGLDQLLSKIDETRSRVVLLLDDAHLLLSSPAQKTLNWILDNQPQNLVTVMAGRQQVTERAQERRMRGALLRVSSDDLAFTTQECSEFLHVNHGLSLDDSQVQQLHHRTEGWAAALQLAALALRDSDNPRALAETFGGTNRDLTDYLMEAVFIHLTDDDREFLSRIAVLDRVCAGLCEFVSGLGDAQRRLESFESRHLFIMPLDSDRRWFRFHSLFRGFVLGRAEASDPSGVLLARKRAVEWTVGKGYHGDAIGYALDAGLMEQAALLVANSAEELVKYRGEHHRLVEWIARIPGDVLRRHPRIQIAQAWSLTFQWQFDEADRLLSSMADAYEDDLGSLASQVHCARELHRCIATALRDHVQAALRLALRWLDEWPQAHEGDKGVVHTILTYCYKCTGEYNKAVQSAESARACFARVNTPFGAAWGDFQYVLLLLRHGRYGAARASCLVATAAAESRLGRNSVPFCMHSTLLAAIALERNELDLARESLSYGLKFLEAQGSIDSILVAYVTLARLMGAENRMQEAHDLLLEGEETGRRRATPRLWLTLAAERGVLLLRGGQLDAVDKVLAHELSAANADKEYLGVINDKRYRLEARLAIVRGDPAAALEMTTAPARHTKKAGQARKHVELLLIRTLALQAMGRKNEALRMLADAVEEAAPEKMIRVFMDEGEPLAALIHELAGQSVQESTRVFLMNFAGQAPNPAPSESGDSDPEAPLLGAVTPREIQILRRLECGLSNKQLASALFVSEATLKWHLYNLYGKLRVRNRAGAIAKSRKLGILSPVS